MTTRPTLHTKRLLLGAFQDDDAPELQRLAGAREIADTTVAIPHPYLLDHAVAWIDELNREDSAQSATFAMRLVAGNRLIGCIALRDIDRQHSQAELGFWVGVEWWGQGYATEAGRAVMRFGFESLRLNRIYAHHMARNPASGRVLLAIGMQQEGLLRQRVVKWEKYEDVVLYAALRDEWH